MYNQQKSAQQPVSEPVVEETPVIEETPVQDPTPKWKPVDAQGIEQGTTSYTVREGNTLGQIASAYNKTNNANITWQ
jgi:cell envelope opacity-associated protein A